MALFDPGEFPEPPAPVVSTEFTARDLLDWARIKDPAEEYCYSDIFGCAITQFLVATRRSKRPWPSGLRDEGMTWFDDARVEHLIRYDIAETLGASPHTFGALVKRLEAIR